MSYDHDAEYKTHESFGQIVVNRISGHNDTMHGTDVPHDAFMELTISHGSVKRNLNQEWYHREDDIIQVQLTHSQFSELISNMGSYSGVPCTIKSLNGKRMENPPAIDRSQQYKEEFRKDLVEISGRMDSAIQSMTELMKKSGATKKEKDAILHELKMIKQDIGSNLPFVEKQFGECIDKATDDAKRNIEGHLLNVALTAAKRGLVTEQEKTKVIGEMEGIVLRGKPFEIPEKIVKIKPSE